MLTLKPFSHDDVPLKVRWINDPRNNRYLHYTLPLEEEATHAWLERVRTAEDRRDLTIFCDDVPVGIIGLLHMEEGSAELYITVGEQDYRGKGIAGRAMRLLCGQAFAEYGLSEIYLLTETENEAAIRSYEKFGMRRIERRVNDVRNNSGALVDRYFYRITKTEYEEKYGELSAPADLSSGDPA